MLRSGRCFLGQIILQILQCTDPVFSKVQKCQDMAKAFDYTIVNQRTKNKIQLSWELSKWVDQHKPCQVVSPQLEYPQKSSVPHQAFCYWSRRSLMSYTPPAWKDTKLPYHIQNLIILNNWNYCRCTNTLNTPISVGRKLLLKWLIQATLNV